MRILLVEDDRMVGEAIRQALRDGGNAVDWVTEGAQALLVLQTSHEHEIMLLDLGLPKMSGLEILRSVRSQGNQVPILILTARDAVDDRVQGLDLGADDYLVKPIHVSELQARIRAVIRRRAGQAATCLTNGELELDLSSRSAKFHDRRVQLTAREFAVLQALMMRPGAILGRNELEERVYGWNEEVESNAIEFLIHGIRKKLGPTAIKNVRGLGWLVVPEK